MTLLKRLWLTAAMSWLGVALFAFWIRFEGRHING